MNQLKPQEELVRRLAAAIRAAELYASGHPLGQRSVQALALACHQCLLSAPQVVIGFVGDEVVVDDARVTTVSAALIGLIRGLRERDVEKITFVRGVTPADIAHLVEGLRDRHAVP